jgi:Family of unknown function (DUF6328)
MVRGAGKWPRGYGDRCQTARDDHRLRDLLRDMRAAGLGALVLLCFLVSISFSSRFGGLSDMQRGMYVTSAALAALAATLLLAPAAYLRLAAVTGPRSR